MTIFKRRSRFCFVDENGIIRKFSTLEDAKKAGGATEKVAVSGVPYKVDSTSVDLGTDDE